MSKYNAAYINALSEVRDPKILFEWICKLHKENVDLRERVMNYSYREEARFERGMPGHPDNEMGM